jgi:hypothetical protein
VHDDAQQVRAVDLPRLISGFSTKMGRLGAPLSLAHSATQMGLFTTTMKSLFAFLNRAPIDAFAEALAGDIAKRYPPALDQQPGKRPSVNRLTRIVEDACERAVAFRAEHRLGWLGKARLANAFRWALTDLGYQKDFVEFTTEAVVVHLSRKVGKNSEAA